MVDLDFTRLCKLLQASDTETKRKYWEELPARHELRRFTRQEIRVLRDLASAEKDPEIARYAALSFFAAFAIGGGPAAERQPEKPAEKLADWLFEPFRDAPAGNHHSLVLSVCDRHYLRDVQAQVEIARLLPLERYPLTNFRHVAHEHPDWGNAGLGQALGVCFIGRPLMFQNCKLIEAFPTDLRFSIVPPESDKTPESGKKEDFHCVAQNRPKAGALRYTTAEDETHRHDFAIVQRFTITSGGRDIVVLVIAGGSSLGTMGAAHWISRYPWTKATRDRHASVAGLGTVGRSTRVDRSMRFEALLKVSARVYKPAKPWDPVVVEESLFLQKSRNLLQAPLRVTLGTEKKQLTHAKEVRYLLFDDYEMDFSPKDNAAVVAFCTKIILDSSRVVRIKDLISDTRVWANGDCPTEDKAPTFLRDHLQRHSLNITVSGDTISLPPGCRIETTLAAPAGARRAAQA